MLFVKLQIPANYRRDGVSELPGREVTPSPTGHATPVP